MHPEMVETMPTGAERPRAVTREIGPPLPLIEEIMLAGDVEDGRPQPGQDLPRLSGSALIFSTAAIAVPRASGLAALSKPICVSLICRKVKGLLALRGDGAASAASRPIDEAIPPVSV